MAPARRGCPFRPALWPWPTPRRRLLPGQGQTRDLQPKSPQAELASFLRAAQGDGLYSLYVVAVAAGLRMGAVLGLGWEDLDLDRGAMQMRRNLQWFNDGPHRADLKTAKSRRTIILPPMALDALRAHRDAQAAERWVAGAAWREHGLVFTTGIGTPLNPSGVRNRSFRRVLERAGLPRIRFHDLRHTMTTLRLHHGENPKVVQEMLDHSTIQRTMDTYAHLITGAQEAAAARMEGIRGGHEKSRKPSRL